MRSPQSGTGPVYEVRCTRCNVSFPVETKKCFHCGGPTGRPGPFVSADPQGSGSIVDVFAAESPVQIGEGPLDASEQGGSGSAGEWPNEVGVEQQDESPSFVKSLLRSFGGFVWIALLIAFSLARSCGD